MPDKAVRIRQASTNGQARPRLLAIAGDSAAGKTTLSRGLVEAIGEDRATVICVDDYHRYDRAERKGMTITPLHPDCNYVQVMEQHLPLLAIGQPILKPLDDHATGELVRPELVEPKEIVIVEGLLPLHTRLSRACFDVSVYLSPPEDIRKGWKVHRDTTQRGYTEDQVLDALRRREPESEAYIRPQRSHADIVVTFAPIEGRDDPPGTPLSATLLLRPTIPHPDFGRMQSPGDAAGEPAMHLKLMRDDDGRPVDALHIHGHAPPEDTRALKKLVWEDLGRDEPLPDSLGRIGSDFTSEPLALTQLILLHHLLRSFE